VQSAIPNQTALITGAAPPASVLPATETNKQQTRTDLSSLLQKLEVEVLTITSSNITKCRPNQKNILWNVDGRIDGQ